MRFNKPKKIESGGGGIILPTLSNPAAATEILKDKESIDGNGNKLIGKLYIDKIYTHNGINLPLTWDLNNEGINCGTLTNSLGNAVAADVASGKIVTTDAGTITGTGSMATTTKTGRISGVAQGTTALTVNNLSKYNNIVLALETNTINYTGSYIVSLIIVNKELVYAVGVYSGGHLKPIYGDETALSVSIDENTINTTGTYSFGRCSSGGSSKAIYDYVMW